MKVAYKAFERSGKAVTAVIEAPDIADARERLRSRQDHGIPPRQIVVWHDVLKRLSSSGHVCPQKKAALCIGGGSESPLPAPQIRDDFY